MSEKSAITIEQYFTTSIGDATRFVREICSAADEPVRFYACGGDGTFQETVVGTLGFSHAQATVIPFGSGNDFVRCFSDPDSFSNLEQQLQGETMSCDIIKINDKYAVNLANVGFDSYIAIDMNIFKRIPLISGSMAYNIALVFNMLRKLGKRLTLTIDNGEPFEVECPAHCGGQRAVLRRGV